MSTYEADERVVEFQDRLTGRARRNLNSAGIVTHADLVKALTAGHTPKTIADACNTDLPSSDKAAYRVLQSRISWFANNPPGSQERPPRRSPHNCADHPDGHVCPWVDTDTGIQRCPCPTLEATA